MIDVVVSCLVYICGVVISVDVVLSVVDVIGDVGVVVVSHGTVMFLQHLNLTS